MTAVGGVMFVLGIGAGVLEVATLARRRRGAPTRHENDTRTRAAGSPQPGRQVRADGRQGRRPIAFVAWLFALSVPFWLAGAFIDFQVLPGLPTSSFAWVCPVLAAAILVHAESGREGVMELLRRSFDFRRIPSRLWYLPALFLTPVAAVLSYALLRLTGARLPGPQITLGGTLALFAAFLVAAECEELGWSGYATEPLQGRFGALGAALLLGAVWAVWHGIALVQAGRAGDWIAWWSLGTVAQRVLIVSLFNNTGQSVFAAALFHAVSNVSWQLFPVNGSHFDPRLNGLILAVMAAAVVAVSDPLTLTRRPCTCG